MRCHFISDLHLEAQNAPRVLSGGDVLIIAGDLCHARALDPATLDKYSLAQRERVLRFMDEARRVFDRIIMVAGNHEHYGGMFEETAGLLRRHLPGVTVLDDETVVIDGIHFFGGTLWTDFEGRSAQCLESVRKKMGEYFFVRTRAEVEPGGAPRKLKPTDALRAHDRTMSALAASLASAGTRPVVIITHHAPSLLGLNPAHKGNGLDGCYASDLDSLVASLAPIATWVHGHTHIRRNYRIGRIPVRTNCRGFVGRDASARGFSPSSYFCV